MAIQEYNVHGVKRKKDYSWMKLVCNCGETLKGLLILCWYWQPQWVVAVHSPVIIVMSMCLSNKRKLGLFCLELLFTCLFFLCLLVGWNSWLLQKYKWYKKLNPDVMSRQGLQKSEDFPSSVLAEVPIEEQVSLCRGMHLRCILGLLEICSQSSLCLGWGSKSTS